MCHQIYGNPAYDKNNIVLFMSEYSGIPELSKTKAQILLFWNNKSSSLQMISKLENLQSKTIM